MEHGAVICSKSRCMWVIEQGMCEKKLSGVLWNVRRGRVEETGRHKDMCSFPTVPNGMNELAAKPQICSK